MFYRNKNVLNKIIIFLSLLFIILTGNTYSWAQTPTTLPPVLDPRGAYLQPVKDFLANTFHLPTGYIDSDISLAVNSAQGLQYVQVRFTSATKIQSTPAGTMTLCLGLPGQSPTGTPNPNGIQTPFPPTITAQIPRVILDQKGVLSFANNMSALSNDQKLAIDALYNIDQVSRGNYAANLLNLAKSLTLIKNTAANDTSAALIDEEVKSLNISYNQLADFTNFNPADPDTVYAEVSKTFNQLSTNTGVSSQSLNTGLNILGIGYSNYLLNRLPINGTNNPTSTTRGALPAFDTTVPLSQAQAFPGDVFGQGLSSYLASIGIIFTKPTASFFSGIVYQVNSADKIQAAILAAGNDQTMTIFFTGTAFPPTNANPPQVAFTTFPGNGFATGTSKYLNNAVNDPTTAQRVQNFFANNASPRAAYIANLNNLLIGFNSLNTNVKAVGTFPGAAINDAIAVLQKALDGLNQSTPIIPDVLGLYQQIDKDYQIIISTIGYRPTIDQIQALATLGRSTIPIGVINYYLRAVVLSQP